MTSISTSKLPGCAPKNFALVCSLFLHVGFIALVSYWQWDWKTPEKSLPKVVKIKFISPSNAQKSTPVKAERFSAAQPYTISSSSIPTLHTRTPELSTPAHQPVKISQHNHRSTKTLTVRPLPIRKTHQLDSVQAVVPLKVRTTGQLKVAQRRISTHQTELWNTISTELQSAFLMKTSISVSKNIQRRSVPVTTLTKNDSTFQTAVEPFKAATEFQSRVAALPREFPESPPTTTDNPSTSNIDTGVVRGLFTGKVRQRIANAKYYPRIARRRGIEGQPVVAFTLDKGGRLMEAGLAKTSGYQLLDQAALEAVQQAAPYPEIPAELNAETFQFKLPISFILK